MVSIQAIPQGSLDGQKDHTYLMNTYLLENTNNREEILCHKSNEISVQSKTFRGMRKGLRFIKTS